MEFVKKIRSSRTKKSELKGLWESAGVSKNSKLQISNNKQITMTKIGPPDSPPCGRVPSFKIPNLFWSLDIGICNLFVIWCLEFDILLCFSIPKTGIRCGDLPKALRTAVLPLPLRALTCASPCCVFESSGAPPRPTYFFAS